MIMSILAASTNHQEVEERNQGVGKKGRVVKLSQRRGDHIGVVIRGTGILSQFQKRQKIGRRVEIRWKVGIRTDAVSIGKRKARKIRKTKWKRLLLLHKRVLSYLKSRERLFRYVSISNLVLI